MQLKYPHFPQKSSKSKDQKSLAAHLEGSHCTLLCRGTSVEKHWSTQIFYKVKVPYNPCFYFANEELFCVTFYVETLGHFNTN